MGSTASSPASGRVAVRGEWPGPITLRRGWARAEARPWNDAHADAHLRLVRGGSGFIAAAAGVLLELGSPRVLSPPLPASAQAVWRDAGFETSVELSLLRLELDRGPGPVDHLVAEGSLDDLPEALRIDAAAFAPFWRLDRRGLLEAIDATPSSSILVVRGDERGLAAFAVLGFGSAISYLQRIAVDAPWQGQGIGRSLLRACIRTARGRGSRAMLLNTQTDNVPALTLYAAEGFATMREPLEVLQDSA